MFLFGPSLLAQQQHSVAINDKLTAIVKLDNGMMAIDVPSSKQGKQQIDLGQELLPASLDTADYNGDGYMDFSLAYYGAAYSYQRIFIFMPANEQFREVKVPERYNGLLDGQMAFRNPYFYTEERVLFSQPSQLGGQEYRRLGWRFTAEGDAYLTESLIPIERDYPWTAMVPITAIRTSYDQKGDTLHSGAVFLFSLTDEIEPVRLPVEQARLWLYNAPGEAKASMYLVKGDEFEVLDYVKGGWLKIRYFNSTYGNIDKYVSVLDVSSPRMDFYREVFSENHGLELAIGDLGNNPDSVYAALLYMGISNTGNYSKQFASDGLYLLFRKKESLDSYKVWTISTNRTSFPIPEITKKELWLDNFVVWKENRYLVDGVIDGGSFFPNDLEPGDYEYRIILVDSRYDLALISNAASLKAPLPKVAWDKDASRYIILKSKE